jgi:photosystem II stability/assembly factor-like uncharacterized protein
MYKILILLICAVTLNSCNISTPKDQTTTVVPKPTGPRKERKEIKKAFFENMHRAEEGFNWKQHNKKTRWENYQKNLNSKSTLEVDGYWKERGSANQAGRIHTAELDTLNNILYCASSGGNIWKGTPEGDNWVSLNDEIKFYDIKMMKIIQMDSLDRLVVCTGKSEFYYTDNQGETWNQSTGLEGTIDWGYIKKAVVVNDSINTIYVLSSEWDDESWSGVSKVYRSTNQGIDFQETHLLLSGIDKTDIWTPYQHSDTTIIIANKKVYALHQDSLQLKSTIDANNSGYSLLAGCTTEESTTLYAYINHELHKSTDNGTSWEYKLELENEPFFSMSFSASITNPEVVYLGAMECHFTTDGGETWETVNDWWDYYDYPENKLHADIPNIKAVLNSEGEELTYVSTDGGLYVSIDQLQTVQNVSLKDLNVSQYYSTYTNRNNTNYVYAGSQDQGFQRSIDGATDSTFNFDQVISGDYGHIVSGDGGESIWMVYPGFADYYPNAESGETGDSWYFPEEATQLWLPPLMADPNFPNTAYLAGGNLDDFGSHIIRLDYDNSISSNQLSYNFEYGSGGGYITAMACSKINTNYWYVLTDNGKFFTSTDYGSTWTKTAGFSGPENHYFYGASIQPSAIELGKVYIAGSGYSNPGVYMSSDNGDSFTALDQGLPQTMIYDIAPTLGDEFIFAATELGPYVYTTETNQWSNLSAGFAPDQIYWTVEFVDEIKTARFGTYGRGIWDFKLDEETSSVELAEYKNTNFSLYPVPAADFITVEFSAKGIYKVSIFDLQGRLVLEENTTGNSSFIIPIGKLKKGTYICKVNGESKSFVKL